MNLTYYFHLVDLAMRFGLHSGPVTAGVLRGDKSRFQLFGDTVNTAARIESTGARNRIHLSQATADLLEKAGKSTWFVPRTDMVVAKGKGEMKTFWLVPKEGSSAADFKAELDGDKDKTSTRKSTAGSIVPQRAAASSKLDRLVDWNVDVLKKLLYLIIAKRNAKSNQVTQEQRKDLSDLEVQLTTRQHPLEEVQEIVMLPPFEGKSTVPRVRPKDINVPEEVLSQLREFVRSIAVLYRDTPFHNFEVSRPSST